MTEFDTIVVGLGVMGSSAAYYLARRDERVLGLDAFTAGHTNGSSHGESRMTRLAYYEHPDYLPLVERAHLLWHELQDAAGEELIRHSGGLFIGRLEHEIVGGALEVMRAKGLEHELLDAAELHRRVPVFHPTDGEVALFDPRAAILFADRTVAAQRRLAQQHGAELRDMTPVTSWTANDDGVVVQTDAGSFHAGRLVITAGPWLGHVLADLNLPLRVERIPVFHWEPRESSDAFASGRFPVWMWDAGEPGVFYGFPQLDAPGVKAGRHHNRDWCRPDTVDRTVNEQDERRVRMFLEERIPALGGRVVERFVCLYTDTPDLNFLIDRHPAHGNVVFAGGFSGHGFKFGPVIGELLADLSQTGQTVPEASFLGLARLSAANDGTALPFRFFDATEHAAI